MLFNRADSYHDRINSHTNWHPVASIFLMTPDTDIVMVFAVALLYFPLDQDNPDDAYVYKAFDTNATILYYLE